MSGTISNLYTTAVDKADLAHQPILWVAYLTFCSSKQDWILFKRVLFRALKACPWSFEIQLIAMSARSRACLEAFEANTVLTSIENASGRVFLLEKRAEAFAEWRAQIVLSSDDMEETEHLGIADDVDVT